MSERSFSRAFRNDAGQTPAFVDCRIWPINSIDKRYRTARAVPASLRGEDTQDMTELSTRERLGRILRMTVCVLSMGFVFPYALMESVDAAKLAAKEQLEAEAADKRASGA